MKRKLALFLSVVMLLGAALPTNVMAYTSHIFEIGTIKNYSSGSILPDRLLGLPTGSRTNLTGGYLYSSSFEPTTSNILANDAWGSALTLQFTNSYWIAPTNVEGFYFELTNAIHAYYQGAASTIYVDSNNNPLNFGNRTFGYYLEAYNNGNFSSVPNNVSGGTGYKRFLETTSLVTNSTSTDLIADDNNYVYDIIKNAVNGAFDSLTALLATASANALTVDQFLSRANGATVVDASNNWDDPIGNDADGYTPTRQSGQNYLWDYIVASYKPGETDTLTLIERRQIFNQANALFVQYVSTELAKNPANSGIPKSVSTPIAQAGSWIRANDADEYLKGYLDELTAVIVTSGTPSTSSATYSLDLQLLYGNIVNKYNLRNTPNLYTTYAATGNEGLAANYIDYNNDPTPAGYDLAHSWGASILAANDLDTQSDGVLDAFEQRVAGNLQSLALFANFLLNEGNGSRPLATWGIDATKLAAGGGNLADDATLASTKTTLIKGHIQGDLNNAKTGFATAPRHEVLGNTTSRTGLYAARDAFEAANPSRDLFYDVSSTSNVNNYMTEVTAKARSAGNPNAKAIPYTIEVDPNYPNRALIRVYGSSGGASGLQINTGDLLVIPVVIKALSHQSDIKFSLRNESGTLITPVTDQVIGNANTNILSSGTNATGTNTTVSSVASAARGRIYLGDIVVTDRAINMIRSGVFFMLAPTGYEWVSSGASMVSDVALQGGSISFAPNVAKDPASGRSIMRVTLSNVGVNRAAFGTFTIRGLALAPLSNDPDVIDNYDTSLTVKIISHPDAANITSTAYNYLNINGFNAFGDSLPGSTTRANSGVSTTTELTVATRVNWNIDYAADKVVDLFSGRKSPVGSPHTVNLTGTLTVAETTVDSWMARKDTFFTVTDDQGNTLPNVKISSVRVTTTNLTRVGGTTLSNELFQNIGNNGTYEDTRLKEYKNASFSRDGHTFILTDLATTEKRLAKATLVFSLTAEPNFDGDVYIKMSGSSISDNIYNEVQNDGIVPIARFTAPVSVSSETSNVMIGYQRYDVSTVVITENWVSALAQPGGLMAANKIQLAIGEYGNGKLSNYMYFAPITAADIALNGDSSFNITAPSFSNNDKVIEITVSRRSSTRGAEITLTNLALNVDRNVPEGNYDLLVGGSAVTQNWQPVSVTNYYDSFDIFGVIFKDYIVLTTPGSNPPLRSRVEITTNSNIAYINGEPFDMGVPAQNVDGRLYVPLRFASVALGVDDGNIKFDDITRKAVIMTAERTVTFTENSSEYTINSATLNMVDDGVVAKAFIDPKYDRMFIPFRYLGEAFNIPVGYDDETKTAIYNPDR